jgi:hypothetical protein
MSSKKQLKRLLRPYYYPWRPYYRPVLRLLYHTRGLTMIPLAHEEIARLLGRPDPTIVEIGCNDGTDTLAFLEAMPMARVYRFERDHRRGFAFQAEPRI